MSLGGITIAAFCWYICTYGGDQMAIQRYLATRDTKAAGTAFITNLTADALIAIFLGIFGFALFAYFSSQGNNNAAIDADTRRNHCQLYNVSPSG